MQWFKLTLLLLFINLYTIANANEWSYLTGDGLTINDIVINPHNTSIIYVSSDQYLLKSESKGQSWTIIGEDFEGEIDSISMDPQNSNSLYVATEQNDIVSIYKTIDSGISWSKTSFTEYGISDLVIDPHNTNILYLVTSSSNSNLYKSIDAGEIWTNIASITSTARGFVNFLTINPHNPDIMYTGISESPLGQPASGVFKSIDQGKTWKETTANFTFFGADIVPIAIDPHNPDILYAGNKYSNNENITKYFLKSTDAGETWTEISIGLPELPSLFSYQISIRNLMQAIAIDPHNTENVYLGTKVGLYRSTDYGESWELLSNKVNGEELRIKTIAIDPQNPEKLYIGTENKGLYQFISDTNCLANYNSTSAKLSIPCLSIDNQETTYKVEMEKQPSSSLFGVSSAELR